MITTNHSPVSGCIWTNESAPLRSCLMSFQSCTMAGQSFLGRQIWVELQSVFSRADTATKIFENKILKRKIFEKCDAILASLRTDSTGRQTRKPTRQARTSQCSGRTVFTQNFFTIKNINRYLRTRKKIVIWRIELNLTCINISLMFFQFHSICSF